MSILSFGQIFTKNICQMLCQQTRNFQLKHIQQWKNNFGILSNYILGINLKQISIEDSIMQMNRNARVPQRANHGKRPCSNVMRRLKKKAYYRRVKEKIQPNEDGLRWKKGQQ